MGGAPQTGNARRDASKRIGAGRTGQPHRGGGRVLLVIGMQDKDRVERFGENRIDHILLGRHGERHAQEILGVTELVVGINEGMSRVIAECHRCDGRNFRDQTVAGDFALLRIVDVGRVVIKRRQRADHAAHHRHGMRVAAEAAEERRQLLMHHRVMGDDKVEFFHPRFAGQLAVQQQMADFHKRRMRGELVDRVAAIEQDALVAVDEGDVALAARGRGEAGIVGEEVRIVVEFADIDDVGTLAARIGRKLIGLVHVGERRRTGGNSLAFLHVPSPGFDRTASSCSAANIWGSCQFLRQFSASRLRKAGIYAL